MKNSGTFDVGTKDNTAGDKVTATGLVNSDTITLFGNSSTAQVLVNITGAAGFGPAGVSGTGHVTARNWASPAIHFAGAARSARSQVEGATLDLEGAHAFVSEGSVAGNSALSGLTEVTGTLELNSGAKITNDRWPEPRRDRDRRLGHVRLWRQGVGGSQFNVGGTLANHGILDIGSSIITQAVLASSKLLTDDNGVLQHRPAAASATAKAELDVASAAGTGAAGVLSGQISLAGYSALRFASGIDQHDVGSRAPANCCSTAPTPIVAIEQGHDEHRAAAGLEQHTAGVLSMDNGASFTTTGTLGLTGQLEIDAGFNNTGGSKVTVGGGAHQFGFQCFHHRQRRHHEDVAGHRVQLSSTTTN